MRASIGTVVLAVCLAACASPVDYGFSGPDGLISSEHQAADDSPWVMTSGSLFRSGGDGWTGVPDAGGDPQDTGSAVFRMVSEDRSFDDVDVTLRLNVEELVTTSRTPARDYDGAHIWVRYRSPEELYAVSVDRRDGTMVIKKKCAGGDVNGGTYHTLSPYVRDAAIPFGQWQQIKVAVRDLPDGTVSIDAHRDGKTVSAIDTGTGCPALTGGGGVGIRGDNAELRFTDIVIDTVG